MFFHPVISAGLRIAAAGCLLVCGLASCSSETPPARVAGGDAARGKAAIQRFGCTACHSIPGFRGHGANTGPPLVAMASRGYLGGVLPNTPENLVRWLRDPPGVDPRTAMPNVGLSTAEATDIAAYLYAHD